MDHDFAAWLDSVRQAVATARASARPTAGGDRPPARDKRLDSLLPMQFEHDGRLLWAHRAHHITLWSAIWELLVYVIGLVGGASLLAVAWLPRSYWLWLAGAFAIAFVMHRIYRHRERPAKEWQATAEIVPGALVYANEVLHQPGPELAANAGFVFTFDPTLAADPERLLQVAKRCFELHRADVRATPAEATLQQRCRGWSEDRPASDPHTFDRVAVPASLCGNEATFMTLVAVSRRDLPDGIIDRRLYPLLARRGRNESVELLPSSFWAGDHPDDAPSADGN